MHNNFELRLDFPQSLCSVLCCKTETMSSPELIWIMKNISETFKHFIHFCNFIFCKVSLCPIPKCEINLLADGNNY